MGVNADLLFGEMRAQGFTQASMAAAAGMSSNAFWRKVHGKNEFLLPEIRAIEVALGLTLEKSREIFFPETVE